MQSSMWDTLTNLLLLFFWFRIWFTDEREFVFNRFLAPIGRVSGAVTNFLKPAFGRTPVRLISAVIFVFLLVFRGVLPPPAPTAFSFGFMPVDSHVVLPRSAVVLSALSFARFLFRLWSLSLIYVHSSPNAATQAETTLSALSRPFTLTRLEYRPLVLLAVGTLFAGVTQAMLGEYRSTLPLLRYGVLFVGSSLLEWIHVIPLIVTFLMLTIIGSWVSTFTNAGGMMYFCQEWLQLLMGRLRNYPLRVGMFDLMPLVMILVLNYVYALALTVVHGSFVPLLQ